MAWNKPTLKPKPFTGLLDEINSAAVTAEGSVNAQVKMGLGVPPAAARTAKAMRGLERMLVALEPYWTEPLPAGKSIKALMAEHEAIFARRRATELAQDEATNAPQEPAAETAELED